MTTQQSSTVVSDSQPSFDIRQAVEETLPYVRFLARKTYHRFQRRFDLEDLEGYGVLGLMLAAQKYDIRKATLPFKKFAHTYIWGNIGLGMSKMSEIHYKQFKWLERHNVETPRTGHVDLDVMAQICATLKDPADIAAFKDDVESKLAFLRSQDPLGAEVVSLRFQGKTNSQVARKLDIADCRASDIFQKSMRLLADRYGFQYTPMTAGRRAVAHV